MSNSFQLLALPSSVAILKFIWEVMRCGYEKRERFDGVEAVPPLLIHWLGLGLRAELICFDMYEYLFAPLISDVHESH